MEYYETEDDYTAKEMAELNLWFEKEVGTDFEINNSASGEPDEYYTIYADLEYYELDMVRLKEREFRNKLKKY